MSNFVALYSSLRAQPLRATECGSRWRSQLGSALLLKPASYSRAAFKTSAVAKEASGAAVAVQQTSNTDAVVQELMDFLKEDLKHLFDDQGIDVSKYDENVDFQDPITKYNSLQGYLFNIQFLRRVFDPTFILHDIRRTGPWEITTRWTMTMSLLGSGPSQGPPRLAFTGTSVMGINPKTGKFNRHWDTWDAVQNQQFFSVEAFTHLLSQVFDLKKTPALETPAYHILRKAARYEVRRYAPFPVAEAPMGTAGTAQQGAGARAPQGVRAFQALARYIFGGNSQGEKMAMTTPVLTDSGRTRMQFVLPTRYQASSPPGPLPGSEVVTKQQEGGVYAVASFSGIATPEVAAGQQAALRYAVQKDGLQPSGEDWLLAQYNDPGTAPPFRRNEVLIPLQNFQFW